MSYRKYLPSDKENAYISTLTAEERKEHFNRRRFPSGRGVHGGAGKPGTLAKEVRKVTIAIHTCSTCGGVFPETLKLTSLFPACSC